MIGEVVFDMKIALVVGHNSKGKGAYSEFLKTSEFDFFNKVAQKIQHDIENVFVYNRVDVGSYTKEMDNLITEIHKDKYDLIMELHFNASGGGGNGVEVLYYAKSEKSKKWASEINQIHHDILGVKIRRIVPVSDYSLHGSRGIMKCKYPYLLTESFFGDNEKDITKVSVDSVAECFIKFLVSIGCSTIEKVDSTPSMSVWGAINDLEARIKKLEGKK